MIITILITAGFCLVCMLGIILFVVNGIKKPYKYPLLSFIGYLFWPVTFIGIMIYLISLDLLKKIKNGK